MHSSGIVSFILDCSSAQVVKVPRKLNNNWLNWPCPYLMIVEDIENVEGWIHILWVHNMRIRVAGGYNSV